MLEIDVNEHMSIRNVSRMFRSLGLVESITAATANNPPVSYLNVSRQADGVWASSDLSISAASFCPRHFSIGDHRIIIV